MQSQEREVQGNPISNVSTPRRGPDDQRIANLSDYSSGMSSITTNGSDNISKSSSGFAKILSENRAMKMHFADTRIKDVEKKIMAMEPEFKLAAQFHANFILTMKYMFFTSALHVFIFYLSSGGLLRPKGKYLKQMPWRLKQFFAT